MARVDLHLHTEYSPDSLNRLLDVARRAKLVGLTHLAVTDHNTIDGAIKLQEVSELPVIVGEEIMTVDGELIGLFLREPVPPGMSASATASAIHQQGALVYLPHPQDPFRRAMRPAALRAIAEQVDIIEVFNGRCVLKSSNERALQLAGQLSAVPAAASDAHTLHEIGRSYVLGPEFRDAQGLLASLAQGTMTRRRSGAAIHLLSRLAVARRQMRRGRVPS